MFKLIKRIIKGKLVKTIPEDLFVKRLRSLVIGEGMLDEGNIYLIDFAIKKMPVGGSILEIGSYGGLSTNLILYLLEKNNRAENLITCDPWMYEGYKDASGNKSDMIDGRKDVSRSEYNQYMKNAFINSTRFLNKNRLPFTFELTSDEFFEKYEEQSMSTDIFGRKLELGQPILFAYIDGNHGYDYAKRDFENADKYLKKSGFILFDDSKDGSKFGSAIFMKEMLNNQDYQFIDKNPNYLFQKIK